jgi:dienelactone hydrolase
MKPWIVTALAFLLGLIPSEARAQKQPDKPLPGDEMIYKYLCAETDKLSAKSLNGAKTLKEWEQKRPRLHQEYLDMLGLWPVPEKTPLKATVTGTLEHEGVIIDKLHFQSKPGLYVTANLYRPKDPPAKRLPAILYVCGHAWRGYDGNKSAHQDHGMWFASNGYICLIVDTVQLGEIPGVHHGTYGTPYRHFKSYGLPGSDTVENRFWWYSAGYTPAGVECWNGIRAIDYLQSRDDVDADRIGVTGISGGGAATFWIAAADERVKCAVPVSGMSDLETYVKDKVIDKHCDCMFLYNTYQWDWATIAALVAPRPLLFANSDDDMYFPMDGNRRIIAKLRQIYTMYDRADLLDEYVSKGKHDYRPDLRIAVFKFFNEHLKKDTTTPVKDAAFKLIEGKLLRVFPTLADIPKDALNGKIDETFVPRAKVVLPEKGKFEEWKRAMLDALRERSFAGFPNRIPAATYKEGKTAKTFITEPTIATQMLLLHDGKRDDVMTVTFVIANHGDDTGENGWDILRWAISVAEKDDSEAIIGPRGVGHPWTMKSPPNYFERSHALLGRTIDQGRLWDICATMAWLQEMGAEAKVKFQFRLAGRGQAGILAAYAALLEASTKEVIILDPPRSHLDGPYFLNVLRVLDIPEALGMLAPRPLTLIGAKDAVFDRTAEIYQRAGAADKLTRK